MKTNCTICGKEFEMPTYNAKYCSKECAKKGHISGMKKWCNEHYEPREVRDREDRCVYNIHVNCTPEERPLSVCVRCGWNPAEAKRRKDSGKYRG